MAALLKRLFNSEVAVGISKDRISLKTDEKVVEFEPILFISSDPGNRKTLGFGSDYVPREAYIKIEPMKPGDLPVPALSKADCLAEILRHHLKGFSSPIALIRPRFIVHGCALLEDILKGYGKKEVSDFFISLGAREVVLKE